MMGSRGKKDKDSEEGASFAGFKPTAEMLQMLNGFTVLRLTSLMGTAGVKMTKEQLLDLNAKLNKIKKPKSK